jgi:hypothetical protein
MVSVRRYVRGHIGFTGGVFGSAELFDIGRCFPVGGSVRCAVTIIMMAGVQRHGLIIEVFPGAGPNRPTDGAADEQQNAHEHHQGYKANWLTAHRGKEERDNDQDQTAASKEGPKELTIR